MGERAADAEKRPGRQPSCAHCGAQPGQRLLVAEGAAYCCESCLFDRRRPAEGSAHGDLYARFAEALAETLDLREHETGLHSKRVACHTLVLARRFVREPDTVRQIYWGALLHDIGKIGVPDSVLLDAAPLTEAQWQVMRTHPEAGYRIVAQCPGMAEAAEIVLCHEERYDGSGYPRGLRGEAIVFGARLFAVIDTLDAMTSDRPYRRGQSYDAAEAEILRMAGSQFDPAAVDAMLAEEQVLRSMVEMKCAGHEVPPADSCAHAA
ncbi:MAG: HD domain-containing protein [Betaproteobacteria bacterium]|nr:HD domain-containing protein [Betaproteobacteria bacterium]